MKKTVVFDMDGVIFDSERLVLKCWKQVAKEYGLKDIEKVFIECVGTNMVSSNKKLCEYYGEDFSVLDFRQRARELFFEVQEKGELPVKKGVRELLEFLKQNSFKVGLASSSRIEVIKKELKDAGLIDYFEVIVGGDMLNKSKPEPDIYLLACEKLNVDPKEAYAIEDSYNGIIAAYRANMSAIMVPDMLEPNEKMQEIAYKIFNDLEEVLEYFKGIIK